MNYSIKLLPIALSDLQKAKRWYQKKGVELANDFKIQVSKELDYISKNPNHYQIKYIEIRQSLVPRFSFAIFYLVDDELHQVIILGILHTSRNPKLIQTRKS